MSHPWGLSREQQNTNTRRLNPISTLANSTSTAQARDPSSSAIASSSSSAFPPLSAGSSSHPANRRPASRNSSISSSATTAFASLQSSSQPQSFSQLPLSGRSRSLLSNNPHGVLSAAGTSLGSLGGGAGASGTSGGVSKVARNSPSLSQSSGIGSPVPPTSVLANSQSLGKILIAQVSLLLGSIPREDQDKAGFDAKTEQIRKLVDSSSMDVFHKYFRRVLQSNAAQIFSSGGKTADPTPTYHLIVADMLRLRVDPLQAEKIATSLDSKEGDVFRDFDLSGFMDHFQLDACARVSLALALKDASKADLRSKAEAILSHTYAPFLELLLTPDSNNEESPAYITTKYLAHIVDQLLRDPPRNFDPELETTFVQVLKRRYGGIGLPADINASMLVVQLSKGSALVRVLERAGPRCTASVQACQDTLAAAENRDINYTQVADSLLYLAVVDGGQTHNVGNFVAALREHRMGRQLDWQDVVQAIRRPNLDLSKHQFLLLYNALLPVAHDSENFDIQQLWGGEWEDKHSQLSFVIGFLTCTPEELDITSVPRLRRAFVAEDFAESTVSIREFATSVANHPLVSLDATAALFNIIFATRDQYDRAQQLGIPALVINANTQVFVVAAAAVPKPWGGLQDQALRQLMAQYINREVPHYDFVFEGLWKQDSNWVSDRLSDVYLEDSMHFLEIYPHVQEHGWVDMLIAKNTELSLELACRSHGEGAMDISEWAEQTMRVIPDVFPKALQNFLTHKAECETLLRQNGPPIKTPPLSIQTVYAVLGVLGSQLPDEEILQLQRACLQAYPRLVNYGGDEAINEIIRENSQEGHGISVTVEAQMTDYFKRLYRQELEVRDYVELLQKFKQSEDPTEQDLFTSMITGLFDEYSCFGEYPLEALAVTAVLFGSVINFNLLERIALQAALAMVLEAVQEHPAEDSMYKFGLQALINFSDRLLEWPAFCDRLILVPQLEGTEIFPKAQEIANQADREVNGNGMTNGNGVDALLALDSSAFQFSCVNADPPLRSDIYDTPNEDTQDKVLFVLNNISERNLHDKHKELKEALKEEHHQWFAQYLVEERAKSQPNFHKLYLDMLQLFDDRMLWAEVLRESYVTIRKLLNSDAIITSNTDRTNLKNLAGWLGSLTLARNKPIKFRNISFKDLLIEGQESQRLTIVIPFTCKTLVHARDSLIFKPPNPWIMEILGILKEIYEFTDVKLNLKFEVEVLCTDLGLDVHAVTASDTIRNAPVIDDDFLSNNVLSMTDGLDHGGFGEMGLMPLANRRGPSERFSPNAILSSLPSLESELIFPPAGRDVPEARQRAVFIESVQQAIQEIIAPVVERSVTIAAISSERLVSKDFALEPDIERFRDAAANVVKSLSGSLALVTCKEPLRMSITNNIRVLARGLPMQSLPEGLILMFVNDNLDKICTLIETAAESQSVAEIEANILEGVNQREVWRGQNRSELFAFPQASQWAFYIPEPYKQQAGGLNRSQLAVYEEFGRNTRGMSTHAPTPSHDDTRAVLESIQDNQFPGISILPTPAVAPTAPQALPLQPPRVQPPVDMLYGQNGVQDTGESALSILAQLVRATQEEHVDKTTDLDADSPLRTLYDRMILSLDSLSQLERDEMSKLIAWAAIRHMFETTSCRLEVEVMSSVLMLACQNSVTATKSIIEWLNQCEKELLLHVTATMALMDNDLVDVRRVDESVAQAIRFPDPENAELAVTFLGRLVDEMMANSSSHIVGFRANFARSFEALTRLVSENPDFELGVNIVAKLHVVTDGIEAPSSPITTKHDQIEYVLEEWVHLQSSPNVAEKAVAAFIKQLHERELLKDREATALFLRACVDVAVATYEEEMRTTCNTDRAYTHTDALAKLVIALVVYQGEAEGAVKANKAGYFEGLLALLVLCMCNHHHQRQEMFAQKPFFRLFSDIILEIHKAHTALAGFGKDVMLVLAKGLVAMQPKYFASFAFGWIALISHRLLLPVVLKDQAGVVVFFELMERVFEYSSDVVRSDANANIAKDLYRAVLRLLLVLHHDFSEFLAENHIRLCHAIPGHCTQLRNLVISAYPSCSPELPDPFSQDINTMDQIDDVRKDPVCRYDADAELAAAGLKTPLDALLAGRDDAPLDAAAMATIVARCNDPLRPLTYDSPTPLYNRVLLTALAFSIGVRAVAAARTASQGASTAVPHFQARSVHMRALIAMAKKMQPAPRYLFLAAMVNQLRFPNAHTHWFSFAMLTLFTPDANAVASSASSSSGVDSEELDGLRNQAVRALLERLLVHRPHPWGLIVALLELLKNERYGFWNLSFVKSNGDVGEFVQQMVSAGPRAISGV